METGGRGEVRATFKPVDGPGFEWVRSLIESALEGPSDRPLIGISIDGHGDAPDTQEIAGRRYNVVREITVLGSADLVTSAGAGGRFHRRLAESLAGSVSPIGDTMELTACKLQKRVAKAEARLEEALLAEDAAGVARQLSKLREVASAKVRVKAVRGQNNKQPVPQEVKQQVAQAKADAKRADRPRRLAERDLERAERSAQAEIVLRERGEPIGGVDYRLWHDELREAGSVEEMRLQLDIPTRCSSSPRRESPAASSAWSAASMSRTGSRSRA